MWNNSVPLNLCIIYICNGNNQKSYLEKLPDIVFYNDKGKLAEGDYKDNFCPTINPNFHIYLLAYSKVYFLLLLD